MEKVSLLLMCIIFMSYCKVSNKETNKDEVIPQIYIDKQVVVANCRSCHAPDWIAPKPFGPPENKMMKQFKSLGEFELFIRHEFANESISVKKISEHQNIRLTHNEIESVIRFIKER